MKIGAGQATSHYLNQGWKVYWRVTRPQWVNVFDKKMSLQVSLDSFRWITSFPLTSRSMPETHISNECADIAYFLLRMIPCLKVPVCYWVGRVVGLSAMFNSLTMAAPQWKQLHYYHENCVSVRRPIIGTVRLKLVPGPLLIEYNDKQSELVTNTWPFQMNVMLYVYIALGIMRFFVLTCRIRNHVICCWQWKE